MELLRNQEKKNKQKKKTHQYLKRRKRKPTKFQKENLIIKEIARERINYLMERAISIYSLNPDLANRYVALSRKYSMSAKVNIPPKFNKLICNKCKRLMIAGVSSRSRIQSNKKRGSRIVITCLSCNNSMHLFFKSKKDKPSSL